MFPPGRWAYDTRALSVKQKSAARLAALLQPLVSVRADTMEVIASHRPATTAVEMHADWSTRTTLRAARAHVREQREGRHVDWD
jgi:hypothetical protein